MRRDQLAVGAIEHVHEAVLVRLDHHLARLAADLHVGEHVLVGRRRRRRRRSACTGSSRRSRRSSAGSRARCRRVQAVERVARPRIVRLGVAGAPVDEIELRIVRAGAPRRPAAVLPRVAVLRPRLGAGLARRRNRVAAPQLLAGIRIPAVEESARGGLAAGHAGDQHAVGDDRRAGGVVALFGIGEFLVPELPCRSSCRARARWLSIVTRNSLPL